MRGIHRCPVKFPHKRPVTRNTSWWYFYSKLITGRTFLHVQLGISQSLRWRHNDHAGVSNHQSHGCLLNRLFRRKSKKTSKPRVTGLCAGNSPGTGEFPAQMASYAENVSIWWRHHVILLSQIYSPRIDYIPSAEAIIMQFILYLRSSMI